MWSVAQLNCPCQSGSGESIWVRKDNPLTPKEDWRISQALMSCELVFISHHKNEAVCVTGRALRHDHHVTESIVGNCSCDGESGGRRREVGVEDKKVLRMFWCLRSLSRHRSRGLRDDAITEAVLAETRILQR